MPKIGSSLLSAFPRIKGVCVRDTALSVVQHIAEVSLNQLILSGVSALIFKASFLSSFVPVDNRFPVTFHKGQPPHKRSHLLPEQCQNGHRETDTALTVAPYQ